MNSKGDKTTLFKWVVKPKILITQVNKLSKLNQF